VCVCVRCEDRTDQDAFGLPVTFLHIDAIGQLETLGPRHSRRLAPAEVVDLRARVENIHAAGAQRPRGQFHLRQ
jgi:hypothetical protein